MGETTGSNPYQARAEQSGTDRAGIGRCGWRESPLSVQWAWPSDLSCELRHETLKRMRVLLAEAWTDLDVVGQPPGFVDVRRQRTMRKEDRRELTTLVHVSGSSSHTL